MTETAPAPPRFTRRRIIAAAVLLVLLLPVAALLSGMFGKQYPPRITTTFVRFEKAPDGTNELAVITLANHSKKDFWLFSYDGRATVHCTYRILTSGPPVPTTAAPVTAPPTIILLGAGSNLTHHIRLPFGGQKLLADVFCYEVRRTPPMWQRPLRKLLGKLTGARAEVVQATCDRIIQCPSVRPDGTIEPARVVPKGER